jgi:hypothetical protein
VWQVHTDFDRRGDPFTGLVESDGQLQAYRWDGFVYDLDEATGKAVPAHFAK